MLGTSLGGGRATQSPAIVAAHRFEVETPAKVVLATLGHTGLAAWPDLLVTTGVFYNTLDAFDLQSVRC